MAIAEWMAQLPWVDLLQSGSIIAGLLFTAFNIRADSRERKIQSLFTLTAAHREIWSKLYEHPELSRVLLPEVETEPLVISDDERLFVHLLILHLAASYRARKLGLYFQEEGLRADIKQFFSRPIPKLVWDKSRLYQERDFVAFVDSCI